MNKIKYYLKRLFSMDYKAMLEAIEVVHKRSKKNKIIIFFDMLICSIKYLSGYMDYKVFYFENLKSYQRKTFVTRGVNNNYIKKMNNSLFYEEFNNKVKFNEIFNKYLNREYIYLKSNLEKFIEFTKKHSEIIVKPIDMQCGKGIKKITITKETNIKNLYIKLIHNKQLLVEEYVRQSKEMNELFPTSVNTLRIVTARKNNKTTVLFKAIRIGNGKNVVDNFNHGGMYSVINDQGVIYKPAIDKNGNVFENHPVTNTKIVGFKIPYFKETINMVKEASKVIPEVGLVGWDIAITKNGPVMIEGNQLPGYDIYQSKIHLNDDLTGVKPLFDKVIYKD